MTAMNTHLSTVTVRINGLYSTVKSLTGEQVKCIFYPFVFYKEPILPFKARHPLRVRGWEKGFQANGRTITHVLTLAKISLKLKLIRRGERTMQLDEGKNSQEHITILNIMHQTPAHTFHREHVTGLKTQINSAQQFR